MKTRPGIRVLTVACGCAVSGYSLQAQASGFALIEQSVTGMGTAYAGGAAQAGDASTVFFNPAGLTRLPGNQFETAVHLVIPQARFNDAGSTNVFTAPLGGGNGGNAAAVAAVPNLYLSHQVNDRLFFGLGINPPFGLRTDYDDSWVGRYHADKSELLTINVNPALAFKATDRLSLGAGINIQYADATLTNAIDIGTLNALPAPLGGFGGAFDALGLVPGASDGYGKVKGDDISLGYNAGLLFEVDEGTRVGLHYRSSIEHTLEGKADFTVPGNGVIEGATGLFRDTNVKATIRLPDSLSASVYHAITPNWALMGDITWTNWDRVPELRIEFDNPAQPDSVTTIKWEDTYRYSLGAAYKPDNRWTWRTGVAYDETPVPSARSRTPRIPDADRLWLAFGASYAHSDRLQLDFAYAHIFVNDPKITKTATGENALRGALNGSYDSQVDLLSAQLRWMF